MCVIILCEKESGFPSLATLESAEKLNAHGGGIAWLENGKVKYKKGIKAKEVFEITKQIQLPAIIHFRIASIGSIVTELCHPFQINDEASTDIEGTCDGVLFHNGTWSEWNEFMMKAIISSNSPMPIGQWSDSRAMAWLANKYGSKFLQLIDTSNKIAVLTPEGIQKFGRYVEVEKNLCSNDYFDNSHDYGFSGLYKTSNSNFNGVNRGNETVVISNDDDTSEVKPLSKKQAKKERKRKEKEEKKQRKLDEAAIKSVAKEITDTNNSFIREQKKDGYILTVKDQLKSKEMDSEVDNTITDETFSNDTPYEQDFKMLAEDRRKLHEQRMKLALDEQDELQRPVRSRYQFKKDFFSHYT